MLGFNRLSREDYVFMGRVEVWTLWDAVCLLTSFEMESTGAFGGTDDLLEFERIKLGRVLEGPEKVYHATRNKWNLRLIAAMASPGVLPYANILDKKEIENPPEVDFVDCCSSFRARDLFDYLIRHVANGDESLDLNILQDYLLGKGSAPERRAEGMAWPTVVGKSVGSLSPEKSKFKRDARLSDRGKKGADNRWKSGREIKAKVLKYIEEQCGDGCTCNHAQLANEVFEYAVDEHGNALMGASELKVDVDQRQLNLPFGDN